MIVSPLVLVRGVIEHCVRIVWLLDPSPEVDPRARCARAVLEELLSADEACRATSHLAGKNSGPHRQARAEIDDLRKRVAPLLDPGAIVAGSPRDWKIAGQTLPSPTDGIAHFGKRWGDERSWRGIYDVLCGYSHPTLLALEFYDIVDGKPVLTLNQEMVDKVVANAIVAYYQAMRHHIAFNGWASGVFDSWEASIKLVFPGMISDPCREGLGLSAAARSAVSAPVRSGRVSGRAGVSSPWPRPRP